MSRQADTVGEGEKSAAYYSKDLRKEACVVVQYAELMLAAFFFDGVHGLDMPHVGHSRPSVLICSGSSRLREASLL